VQSVQDGRIHIELINLPFLRAGGSPAEYGAGLKFAIVEFLAVIALAFLWTPASP
jgi:hypothetical protein